MKLITAVLGLLCSVCVFAAPATIEWQWPSQYCDGTALDTADIEAAEIYIGTSPITSSAEIEGDSCASPADIPPDSAVMQSVDAATTSVQVDLAPGSTYYVRMRVQLHGQWSNLSAQVEQVVPFGRPQVPIIIRVGR